MMWYLEDKEIVELLQAAKDIEARLRRIEDHLSGRRADEPLALPLEFDRYRLNNLAESLLNKKTFSLLEKTEK